MRIVFDIDFGSTYRQTYLGIYDFDTNTLEYISKSKLEEKVRKGYQVTDLAMKTVDGLKPQLDIINTCIYSIPTLQKLDKREWDKQDQTCLTMTQPIYLKNLRSGLCFNYKNVTFTYQKRKNSDEWTVRLPKGMTAEIGIQTIYQLVPYLLCGNVFIIRFDGVNQRVWDFSALTQLSNTKCIQLFSYNPLFCDNPLYCDKVAVRLSGLVQNLRFDGLFDVCITNNSASNKANLNIVDLSNLYCNEQTKLDDHNLYLFSQNILGGMLMLFPNMGDYAQKCKEAYDRFGLNNSSVKRNKLEWINIGNIPKHSDYIITAKKQVAKYSLMGKNIADCIFYTTII